MLGLKQTRQAEGLVVHWAARRRWEFNKYAVEGDSQSLGQCTDPLNSNGL